MWIKVTRGTLHLNYAYREGSTGNLPDHIAKDIIKHGCGVPIKPPIEKVEEEPDEQPIEVVTAVVKKTRTRPVKK